LKVNENDLGAFELLAKYYISKKDKISATLYTQKILQHYPNLMNGLVQELFKQINNIP
jgi:hypothetical protein